MEFAAGAFGWPEQYFWATSLRFWDRAIAGYRKANGVDPDKPAAAMTRSRLEELKAQFPDSKSK